MAAHPSTLVNLWLLLACAVCIGALADPGPTDYHLLDPCRNSSPLAPPASGAEVIALQNALAGATFPTPEPLTGMFDNMTLVALQQFQASRNLTADGVVGPITMRAFDVALGLAANVSLGLLTIRNADVTPAITAGAVAILHEYGRHDLGLEVPFEADSAPWVGRLELHYHPFNGTMRPWGYHHGVSVYCLLNASCAAPSGSKFLAATAAMSVAQREGQILAQLLKVNSPPFLLNYSVAVTSTGGGHSVTFHALPDYLSIGNATDFVRIPTAAFTAQRVADAWLGGGASLPTTKMVDLIAAAERTTRIAPHPLPPNASMTTNAWFKWSNDLIEAELAAAGSPPRSDAVAGAKKDIVITNEYVTHPVRVYPVCVTSYRKVHYLSCEWLSCANSAPMDSPHVCRAAHVYMAGPTSTGPIFSHCTAVTVSVGVVHRPMQRARLNSDALTYGSSVVPPHPNRSCLLC